MQNNLITVTNGQIQFDQREVMFQQAKEFLDKVKHIEVNEESIKEAKKGAAIIRKRVNNIEDERKRVKKEILIPYNTLESQIKEITSVLNEADSHIRDQVNGLEEKRREDKKNEIEKIFDLRKVHYNFDFMTFDHFFKKQYLNQGYSMDKVEFEMVEWFEKTKGDLDVIHQMDNKLDILNEYVKHQDFNLAFNTVQKRQNDISKLKVDVQKNSKQTSEKKILTISFKDKDNADLAIQLLENNGLDFKLI